MKVKINPSIAYGKVVAQPSKSYAHRLLIASFLTNKKTTIKNVVMSNDILETTNIIRNINNWIEYDTERRKIKMYPKIDRINPDIISIECIESGSTLRFFIPILLSYFRRIKIESSKRLIERGIEEYLEIFKDQDIKINIEDYKIIVEGKLRSGHFVVDCKKSSQFLTGLLFALPLVDGESTIEVKNMNSKNYIDMTLEVLRLSGIIIKKDTNDSFIIPGNQTYNLKKCKVEGDYSNSSFIDALNYLDGNVKIKGLNEKSLQGDKVYNKLFAMLDQGSPTIDIKNCIDLGPILFCMAALKHGATFINTNRLKSKESDRILSLKEELAKFNVEVIEEDNKVIIKNDKLAKPTEMLESHNDHRILMALSIMLSKFGGEINHISCVNKSYPNFFNDLKKLNINLETEN